MICSIRREEEKKNLSIGRELVFALCLYFSYIVFNFLFTCSPSTFKCKSALFILRSFNTNSAAQNRFNK